MVVKAGSQQIISGERRSINVFLCHNSKDKADIKLIADALELDFGIPHFLDAYAIPTGEAFIPWIEKKLNESAGCAIFLGSNGWGPTHHWEAEMALARARKSSEFRLIPVALDGITQPDMERLGSGTLFREINWADFRKGPADPEALEKFRIALTGDELQSDRGPTRLTPYQIRRDAARWVKSKGTDTSILYRGQQLAHAERLAQVHSYIGAPALFDLTKDAFLELFNRPDTPIEDLRIFAGWVAAIMVANQSENSKYSLTSIEARSALRRAGVRILPTVAHRLAIELQGAKAEDKLAKWRSVVGPVFQNVWPLDIDLQTSASTFNLVQILLASGAAFFEAGKIIIPFIRPDEPNRHSSTYSISNADDILYSSSPQTMLDLLSAVVGEILQDTSFVLAMRWLGSLSMRLNSPTRGNFKDFRALQTTLSRRPCYICFLKEWFTPVN